MRPLIQALIFNRSIATIQGRPLGIRDETFDIRLPDESDIPDMITIPNTGLLILQPPPQHLALSIYRFKLDRYISEIKLLLYHLPSLRTNTRTFVWPTNIPDIQHQIKSDLDDWLTEVSKVSPSHDMEVEEKLKLHYEKLRMEQLYHNTVALLFQPSQMFPSPSQDAQQPRYASVQLAQHPRDILLRRHNRLLHMGIPSSPKHNPLRENPSRSPNLLKPPQHWKSMVALCTSRERKLRENDRLDDQVFEQCTRAFSAIDSAPNCYKKKVRVFKLS